MKKLLAAGIAAVAFCGASALAADMPVKAPVYKAPELFYDWSGFYLGAYTGVGIQQSRAFDPAGGTLGKVEYTGAGFNGGATAGYNWQFNRNWLVGVEGDIGYLGLSHRVADYNDSLDSSNSKTSWIGTARGRVGYISGPTLNYITAGGAWVHVDDNITSGAIASLTGSKTQSGVTIGSGVETMLGGNWTAKAEYSYVDVGHGPALGPVGGGFSFQTDRTRYETMKFGINYLFGGKTQPPLMAHNWTGFYAGGLAGSATTETRASDPTGATLGELGNNGGGFTAGGLAGYNLQFAPHWVAGVEADFSWFGIHHSYPEFNNSTANFGVNTSWLATARGRVGYSTGPALLYLTGGGAWIDVRDKWFSGGPVVTSTKTLSGGTIGGGIETVINSSWTSKTEYLYIDAGKGGTLASGGFTIQADHTFHVFRSALIYKFGTQ